MADPMKPEFTAQNPIVEAATRLRARRDIGRAIDGAGDEGAQASGEDAEASLRLFVRVFSMARNASTRFSAKARSKSCGWRSRCAYACASVSSA